MLEARGNDAGRNRRTDRGYSIGVMKVYANLRQNVVGQESAELPNGLTNLKGRNIKATHITGKNGRCFRGLGS